jgi:SNF2 family DNA or RNA helicase
MIIEPYMVQLSSSGNFSLVFERAISYNLKYFPGETDDPDRNAIELLDLLTTEAITRKFSPKKRIRPTEFFEKLMDTKLFNHSIRPYIEHKLVKILNLIHDKEIFIFDHKNPTHDKVSVPPHISTALFHIRRSESGTNYFITLKSGQTVINQLNKGSQLLSEKPCWMLIGNQLLHFDGSFDGNKLKPFLEKPFMSVRPQAEEHFYKKFLLPLIEQYPVVTKGIDIITEQYRAIPMLQMEQTLKGGYGLVLRFSYGPQKFHYHSGQWVSAILDQTDGNFTVKCIKRSKQWEESKRKYLESLQLQYDGSSVFLLLDSDNSVYSLINWLSENKKKLEAEGIEIRQNLTNQKFFIGPSEISIVFNETSDWFDIRVKVMFGSFEIPFVLLRKNIIDGNREYLLPDGSIAILPEEWLHRMGSLLVYSQKEEAIVIKKNLVGLMDQCLKPWRTKEHIEELKKFEVIEAIEIPIGFRGQLRSYQKAGFDWFFFLQKFNFGGCLADDMGLGKTIQTLALLQKEKETTIARTPEETIIEEDEEQDSKPSQLTLFETHKKNIEQNNFRRTSLLVVPASIIYNWSNEAAKFTPDLRLLNHTGLYRTKTNLSFKKYDLVITTYGTLRNDEEMLRSFFFHYIILDESQIIKNPRSMTAASIKSLKSNFRLTLTGTPVENTILDLWSQVNFLNPGLLGGYKSFQKNFITPIEKERNEEKMEVLKSIIKPFVLRRTKSQVAPELPEKTEQVVHCEMTPEQKSTYEKVKSQYRNEIMTSIAREGLNKSRMYVIKGLTELRQIANHPVLTNNEYKMYSGKFNEITRMIETVVAEGHKILLFSQFVKHMQLFQNHFHQNSMTYCYIDGSIPAKLRQHEVERFQNDESVKIFLISLKAGGVGLNLTAADYVFISDPWWNPAAERQAIDRTHRIGQTKKVFSYRFISTGTVEEKIAQLQERKKILSDSLIETENSFIKILNIAEIEQLFL